MTATSKRSKVIQIKRLGEAGQAPGGGGGRQTKHCNFPWTGGFETQGFC